MTMKVKVMEQISISIKVISGTFTLPLTVFEILTFQMFDLENLGQGFIEIDICHQMVSLLAVI